MPPLQIPSVRILPMSSKLQGFHGLTIQQVQQSCFLLRLPTQNGQFHYQSAGLNAPSGTIVLFQFQARIIATARFLRDEKFDHPLRGHAGILHFDALSIRTFTPLDLQAMRTVWPNLRAFGHVKQFLNPALFATFKRRLKQVESPLVQTVEKSKR